MHKVSQHMQNKKEKKAPGTLSYIARVSRAGFGGKATTPETVAHTSQRNLRLPEKNTLFRAYNIQIASMM